jgi:hypothetical protein
MRLAVSNLIDPIVTRDNPAFAKHVIEMTKLQMTQALGEAAVKEGAVWSEERVIHLPGCPLRLHAVLEVANSENLYHFESRARRGDGPWLTRMLRRLGHQLFLWADRYERHAQR